MIYSMPETKCPKCNQELDSAMVADDDNLNRGPQKNDYTICIKCCAALQFNEDLTLRVADSVPYRVQQNLDKVRRYKNQFN